MKTVRFYVKYPSHNAYKGFLKFNQGSHISVNSWIHSGPTGNQFVTIGTGPFNRQTITKQS